MKSATSSPMLACPCSCAERCAVLCSWLPQESIAAFEQSQRRRTKCVFPVRRDWLYSNSPFDSCRNQLYTAILAVLQHKGHARSRSDRLRDGLPDLVTPLTTPWATSGRILCFLQFRFCGRRAARVRAAKACSSTRVCLSTV